MTRKGCHLCDDALRLLREARIEPRLADVDADDRLFELYDWRVPVVLVDGRPVLEGLITRDQVAALRQRAPGP